MRPLVCLSILFAMALPACAVTPNQVVPRPKPDLSAIKAEMEARETRFETWKTDFKRRAIAKGYAPNLVNTLIDTADINAKALERDKSQPEFTKPVWSYVDGAASNTRIAEGQAKLQLTRDDFDAIEAQYHVPREILTAIWGLESAYGSIMGTHEIISALATFAFEGRRTSFGESQLFAVLDLVRSGAVRPDQLTGSWAGAMGMTQFIPTTFRDYAVDFDGDGNKNLWESPADALASAANYLSRSGWVWGAPVMAEVQVPDGFDYALADGSNQDLAFWGVRGIQPIAGGTWAPGAGDMAAKLLVPAGHRGPKFLTFKNFEALRRYNNSTSYVMGIYTLSQAYQGGGAWVQDWPRGDLPLSFEDKKALQARLTELGYNTGGVDGNIGPNTRKAIRAWQKKNNLPADGYLEQSLYKRVMFASQ